MSIVSVFAVMLMVMLLGMVMNAGREVDGKIRMQNAADSVAYSGGVVLARGMNTLAFTNHLLCEVLAMTAYLREAQSQDPESFVPRILDDWKSVGQVLAGSSFTKFSDLGTAIQEKVTLEQNLVDAFANMVKATSDRVLPVMEEILNQELIPQFQRSVVTEYPKIAQTAAEEVAKANGNPDHGRGTMFGALWHPDGTQLAGDQAWRLPVSDPNPGYGGTDPDTARTQRDQLAYHYLRQWNWATLCFFATNAKMSQFYTTRGGGLGGGGLWGGFTCGQMPQLLEKENYDRNLPHMIRNVQATVTPQILQADFTVVGVVYWKELSETASTFMGKTLFNNPATNDALAFAESRLFVPRKRRVWWRMFSNSNTDIPIGGSPGSTTIIRGDSDSTSGTGPWTVGWEGKPQSWDLWTQNWTTQLVPTKDADLATILTKQPKLAGGTSFSLRLPSLGSVSNQDLESISPH